MITLYDLVFQDDRRPSPFCWRAKFALAHKGLDYTNVPMGFTEKDKIAFADSKTVPVLKDGDKAVKDSWAIAVHLDEVYPDAASYIPARFASGELPSPDRLATFGGGPHLCLGMNLARVQAMLVLAVVQTEFEITPAGPVDMTPRFRSVVTPTSKTIPVRVATRDRVS